MIPGIVSVPVAEEGGGYTGPLDLLTGVVCAYSVRAMALAGLGGDLFELENADTELETFASDGTTGAAPTASIATFLDGGAGENVSWLDLSGHDYHAASETGLIYTAALANGKPGFTGTGVEKNIATGIVLPAGALRIVVVVKINPENAPLFFVFHGPLAARSKIAIGSYWNVEGDFYVELSNAGGTLSSVWASTELLAEGVHVFGVNIAADGTVSMTLDGDDAVAALADGAAFPPEGEGSGTLELQDDAGDTAHFESYICATASSAASAIANSKAYYGIP